MNKKRILIIVLIILIVISFIFYTKKPAPEEDARTKLGLEPGKYIDSVSAVLKLEEDPKSKNNIEAVQSLRDKKKFDENLRPKIIELLGMTFQPLEKPNGTLIESIDKGKYIQNKYYIQTSPVSRAPLYLLVPKILLDKNPAIIAMHQHGGNYAYGKEEIAGNVGNPDLFYGKELAERGYVVLAMDSILFGERFNKNEKTSPRTLEELVSQNLYALGIPPLGIVVQEDLTSLNFLSSLDFVDKNNIGCIGHSFGGTRCTYLSVLDNRIKATALLNSVSYFISGRVTSRNWLAILPGIGQYTGKRGVLAIIAPRSLLILYTENDPIFSAEETKDIVSSLKQLYTRLDNEDKFSSIFLANQSHSFPKEAHEQVYRFFDRNLNN